MMARHASETPRSVSLDINVKLADGVVPVRRHPPAVYAFARSGQLIDKTAADVSGHVQLRLPDLRVMQEVRVMVGPDTQAEQSTVNELARRGAKEQFVRISPTIEPPVLEFEIQPTLYSSWLRHCAVRGVLLRHHPRANIPIGDAGVQVWEIEPVELMIAKLPDAVVEDFRDLLLVSSGKRRTDAGRDATLIRRAALRAARLQSTKPLVADQMRSLQATPQFAPLISAANESAAGLRNQLIQAAASLRLLLCLLYPAWIRKHMLANAITDADGCFRAPVFPSSHCPDLNLYFTASTTYYGTSVPVYDPRPVASFTYWDYQAGTEVALLATDETSAVSAASPSRDEPRIIAAGSV
jgi:hypothetical protein